MVVAKPTDLRLDETYMKTSVILAILRGKTTVQGGHSGEYGNKRHLGT